MRRTHLALGPTLARTRRLISDNRCPKPALRRRLARRRQHGGAPPYQL